MKYFSTFNRIYLATEPVDFRKQAQGLAVWVEQEFGIHVTDDKKLFLFTNKR